MSETQKIFFGITLGLLVGFMIFILPIDDIYHRLIVLGLVSVSGLVYSNGLPRFLRRSIKTTDNDWSNINHLRWVYNRMKHIHKENENYDYMIKLKKVIDEYEKLENK
jgi:hypothetical protein